MTAYTHQFLWVLAFTDLVELCAVFLYVRWRHLPVSTRRILYAGLFASFSTIPYVWYVFPSLFPGSLSTAYVVGEVFATTIETFIYAFVLDIRLREGVAVSIFANAASLIGGYFIHF